VLEHRTNFGGDYVELKYDADTVSIDEIMDGLEGIGYRPAAYRPVTSSD
jgi:hypothetical protein